jgi:hypothetical protein
MLLSLIICNIIKSAVKAEAEVKEGIRELKKKRAVLQRKIKRLEAASREKWEAAKQKVNEAIEQLEKTYDKVRSYFKS